MTSPLDSAESWLRRNSDRFHQNGIAVQVVRTRDERPNASMSINLRRGPVEADFVIWESGEGEVALAKIPNSVSQIHYEQLHDTGQLESALAKIIEFVSID